MVSPKSSQDDANNRITILWERAAVWLCGAAIALLVVVYQDMKTTVDKLEERVQFLYLDKVSKQELKELADRMDRKIDAGNADVISRINRSNEDILSKIDLMIKAQK